MNRECKSQFSLKASLHIYVIVGNKFYTQTSSHYIIDVHLYYAPFFLHLSPSLFSLIEKESHGSDCIYYMDGQLDKRM